MKDNNEPIILIITGTMAIRAYPTHLCAEVERVVGSYTPKELIKKTYPDVEDLFALPLKGLMKLALEFYGEIKAAQQTSQLMDIRRPPYNERAT